MRSPGAATGTRISGRGNRYNFHKRLNQGATGEQIRQENSVQGYKIVTGARDLVGDNTAHTIANVENNRGIVLFVTGDDNSDIVFTDRVTLAQSDLQSATLSERGTTTRSYNHAGGEDIELSIGGTTYSVTVWGLGLGTLL